MTSPKQLGFQLLERKNAKFFGGGRLGPSNPKAARPISLKRSMHLVLKAAPEAGRLCLIRRERILYNIISRQGRLHGVKVYRQANGGNHLHLIVRPLSRRAFHGFIRSITGLIAREVLGAERGAARQLALWLQRPFSRIVQWGRDFKNLCVYLDKNALEAWGFMPYTRHAKLTVPPIPSNSS